MAELGDFFMQSAQKDVKVETDMMDYDFIAKLQSNDKDRRVSALTNNIACISILNHLLYPFLHYEASYLDHTQNGGR